MPRGGTLHRAAAECFRDGAFGCIEALLAAGLPLSALSAPFFSEAQRSRHVPQLHWLADTYTTERFLINAGPDDPRAKFRQRMDELHASCLGTLFGMLGIALIAECPPAFAERMARILTEGAAVSRESEKLAACLDCVLAVAVRLGFPNTAQALLGAGLLPGALAREAANAPYGPELRDLLEASASAHGRLALRRHPADLAALLAAPQTPPTPFPG